MLTKHPGFATCSQNAAGEGSVSKQKFWCNPVLCISINKNTEVEGNSPLLKRLNPRRSRLDMKTLRQAENEQGGSPQGNPPCRLYRLDYPLNTESAESSPNTELTIPSKRIPATQINKLSRVALSLRNVEIWHSS